MRQEMRSVRSHSRTQREVVREVMLAAAKRDEWMTLRGLAELTHFAEASISAQLRHLRKPENGEFIVMKRPRDLDEAIRLVEGGTLWEYRIARPSHIARRSSGIACASSRAGASRSAR